MALTKYIKPPRRSPMLMLFLSKWAELQSTLMKKSTFFWNILKDSKTNLLLFSYQTLLNLPNAETITLAHHRRMWTLYRIFVQERLILQLKKYLQSSQWQNNAHNTHKHCRNKLIPLTITPKWNKKNKKKSF